MADYRLVLTPDVAEIPRLLDWVETCCGDAAVGDDMAFKLSLALEEAVVNVINYALAHHLAVELVIDANRISAEVIDNGAPFDPVAAPEAKTDASIENREIGGLGIHLVRRLMDRVDYRRVGDENRLRLEKDRE